MNVAVASPASLSSAPQQFHGANLRSIIIVLSHENGQDEAWVRRAATARGNKIAGKELEQASTNLDLIFAAHGSGQRVGEL